ncbi:MAG TPA: isoprenylcysteine carboxylmethyltransferase family protein [Candidatus Acidoferrum sp.]|jgi:protein-S-isoprenylcysteine O-methyltransferase Ste14|nr:isoprenylcysteine carboxylmethyltransferase family protein [Candidatus Acidoferrum sp.]
MPNETATAIFLTCCLTLFFTINLHNVLRLHKRRPDETPTAEVEQPSGIIVGIAALGTLVYFLEALVYLFLVFTNLMSKLESFPFIIEPLSNSYLQLFGAILTATGYFTFLWSVITRGRYSVSWAMHKNHKLITSGPYHYVRHPSYLGYYLIFIGLFLLWPTPFTLIPLAAVPGYYLVTEQEEKLLTERFGTEYTEYQKRTGRFIPKLRQQQKPDKPSTDVNQ